MKEYFYKGKLVRRSNSEKLNYKFLLVDKNDNSARVLSSNKENLKLRVSKLLRSVLQSKCGNIKEPLIADRN